MLTLFFPAKQVIRDNRSWLVLATAIFMICAIAFYLGTAYSEPVDDQALDSQLGMLQELFAFLIEAKPLVSALLVFMNNFLSMAQMLLLGVLAGISPLFTLGINGALVGVLLSLAVQEGASLLPLIMLGIMPHGIFELFAFFLCGAIGLKFGYHCVASPLPGISRIESFRYIWKEAISILPLIITLLIISAFVEMFITPHLFQLLQ
ncbi:MAG: stage II sporulation protein M [Dethiobacteria bacterium]|nr:stage II sporulation protein M [Dethiobacteria bacterium]